MNNSRTDHFGSDVWGLCVLNGPIVDGFRIDFSIALFLDVSSIWGTLWFRFASMFTSFFDLRICIDFGSVCFRKLENQTSKIWFYYSNNIVFEKTPFREQVICFINFSVMLAPSSDDYAIISRYFFAIDFVDFKVPKWTFGTTF